MFSHLLSLLILRGLNAANLQKNKHPMKFFLIYNNLQVCLFVCLLNIHKCSVVTNQNELLSESSQLSAAAIYCFFAGWICVAQRSSRQPKLKLHHAASSKQAVINSKSTSISEHSSLSSTRGSHQPHHTYCLLTIG